MNPKLYETLAAQHIDSLHREAAGGHRISRGADAAGPADALRRWIDRRWSVRRLAALDVARPGGDLRSPRRAELGQDVLDVAARRLGRDHQ